MGENIGEALIADAFKNLSDAQQTTTKAVPTFEEFSNELNREEALNMTTAVENLRSSGRLPEGINTLEQFYNRFLENDVNFADFGTISSPNIDSSPVKSEIARIQQQLQSISPDVTGEGISPIDLKVEDTLRADEIAEARNFIDQTAAMTDKLQLASIQIDSLAKKIARVADPQERSQLENELSGIREGLNKALQTETLEDGRITQKAMGPEGTLVKLNASISQLSGNIQNLNRRIEGEATSQSTGYVPSFTSQTQVVNQLSKQPEYKMAMQRERKASGSIPVIEHSKMLGMHAVYNKEQQMKYGSIDATIKRDHLAMGQDPNSYICQGLEKKDILEVGLCLVSIKRVQQKKKQTKPLKKLNVTN